MASLSLPRVLQLRRNNGIDVEREQFEKFQSLAINKAINSQETPVKEKHVRSTIIGSFQEQGAVTYWVVASRLPLQENRIVAWKFCHVTHKLLREGHPACLDDSQRHVGMIENLGKLWVHLREGYGRLVHLYCGLLACKLRFHQRNPRFPGHMQLTADELDNIAENDVNNYFQLCVELFDYMDEILSVQAAVFESLGNARANSMTASGQCRLAALIPCAQDSSHIYDCGVRLMFKLHASLPADTLAGHRERFRQQFKKLSAFYKHASTMQYYRNLLSLPTLPSNPPNFLVQSDFGTYVAPVVSIPEQVEEPETVGSLVDMSEPDSVDMVDTRTTPSPQPDLVLERDRLIDHLQSELKRVKSEATQLLQERTSMLSSMRDHCNMLEGKLNAAMLDLEEERQKAEQLTAVTPEMSKKLLEAEDKAKVTDEKFQKLKGAYTQLREEHIALIRQKAEVDKMAATLRSAAAEHEAAKTALQQQLNDKMKDVEILQQSASNSEAVTQELDTLRAEISSLRTQLSESNEKISEFESLQKTLESIQVKHKSLETESHEKLEGLNAEIVRLNEELTVFKNENEIKESEISRLKEEINSIRNKTGEEFSKVVEEKDKALKEIETLKEEHEKAKQEFELSLNDMKTIARTLENKLTSTVDLATQNEKDLKNELVSIKANFEFTSKDYDLKLHSKDNEIEGLRQKNKNLELDLQHVESKCNELSETYKNSQESYQCHIKTLENEIYSKNQNVANLLKDLTDVKVKFDSEKASLEHKLGECLKELEDTKNKLDKEILMKETYQKEHDDEITHKNEMINELKFNIENITNNMNGHIEALHERESELTVTRDKLAELKAEYESFVESSREGNKQNDEQIAKLKEELHVISKNNDTLLAQYSELTKEYDKKSKQHDTQVKTLHAKLDCLQSEKLTIQDTHEKEVFALKEKNNNREEAKNKEIHKLKTDLERILAENRDIVKEKDGIVREKDDIIFDKDDIISEKDAIISEKDAIISEKELVISNKDVMISELNNKVTLITNEKQKEVDNINFLYNEAIDEKKSLEGRLERSENDRITVECELQDLLQNNSALEQSLSSVKQQLILAQQEIEKQRASTVQCAAQAALELISGALLSLERGSSQDSSKAAALAATNALNQLSQSTEIRGRESVVASSAVVAAGGAAQLAGHAAELANATPDLDRADKLTAQCRQLLASTRACMERLAGEPPAVAGVDDVTRRLEEVSLAVVAVDSAAAGPRSVDDELADMDKAIEEAASRIDEMLAASKAGDSGVKLEVNGKILDACTALMAAVRILVQDSRSLQRELGDPGKRQKVYRRNPQWSEGLISAAKAVVFAAKLLVSSADDAVGGGGALACVGAAGQEVGGATAQLVAASRASAPPGLPALQRLAAASRSVALATGALVAIVRDQASLLSEQEALDTSALTLTATRRLEMESKVRSLELESALDAERARLAALRRHHYRLAQIEENGVVNGTNGK